MAMQALAPSEDEGRCNLILKRLFPTIFLFQRLESLRWWGEGMLVPRRAVVAPQKVGCGSEEGALCP